MMRKFRHDAQVSARPQIAYCIAFEHPYDAITMTSEQLPLLTEFEAADLVGGSMNGRQMKRLAKAGKAPSVVLPDGEVRFCRDDLLDWIESHKSPKKEAAAVTPTTATA